MLEIVECQNLTSGWDINPAEFDATIGKLERLASRATNRGLSGALKVEFMRTTETRDGITRPIVRTNVIGNPPKFENWEFVARVEYLPGATKPMIGYAGKSDDYHNRITAKIGTDNTCDHCGVKRYRKFTYIAHNVVTDEFVQVGSTCLRDFLGGHDVSIVWKDDQTISDIMTSGTMGDPAYLPSDILRIAMLATKEFGFVPTNGDGLPTRERIMQYLHPHTEADRAVVAAMNAHSECVSDINGIIATVLTDMLGSDSSYADNVTASLTAEYVTHRQIGIIASVPRAYERIVERDVARQATVTLPPSEHVGTVGDKVSLTATITGVTAVHGAYGISGLIRWQTESGDILFTFTTAKWSDSAETGQTGIVTGTVKRHDEYKGTKQTQLTRTKFVTNN